MDLATAHSPIRVLVVDDDEEDFFILKKIFAKIPDSPFVVDWVGTFDEGIRQIDAQQHDIFLIDYQLGEHTGLELLRRAKADRRSEPFILLTGLDDRELEWRSIRMAAADYLIKGKITSDILLRALSYALERKQIEEQRLQHLMDLNRSKDEFISIASHQLRTPATAVKQYLGMLIEGFAGDLSYQQQSLLKKAYENNERQLSIVTDLLRVAQVDAGQVMLRKEKVALNELVEDVIRDIQAIAFERHQLITSYPAPDNPEVIVDKSSIRMVFENLIDNASKYSEDGKTITVGIIVTAHTVKVEIRDEGVGIQTTDLDRLFEKFSRFENPLSTKVGGTGLGLYWARKIVNLHDGVLMYTPAEPEGSVFTVELPKTSEL